jgi:hypothetical protein
MPSDSITSGTAVLTLRRAGATLRAMRTTLVLALLVTALAACALVGAGFFDGHLLV